MALGWRTVRQVGWAVLGALLVGFGFFAMLPYIRSEAIGVLWPPHPIQRGIAALAILGGLAVSRRAGRFQYATFAAAAGFFIVFCWATRAAMEVAGVKGIF